MRLKSLLGLAALALVGLALVAPPTQAGRETTPENPANSTPALTDGQKPPMTIIGEPSRAPVPSRRRQKDDGSSA